jgi:2Fe-2S ferredoxin
VTTKLIVTDRERNTHALDAPEGWRVMEILRDHGLDVEGVCGGTCDCATCHVEVAPDWADRLHPPRDDELDKLDELPEVGPRSRLSCQLIWSAELDGLHVHLPED